MPSLKKKEEEKEEKIVEPSFEKKIEKNLDKPRPLLKKEKSNEKNFDEKLEKTKENLSEIVLNLSKLYLSETETMINTKNIHGIEHFLKGPMKNLIKYYNELKK